jgi:Sulfotransferase family
MTPLIDSKVLVHVGLHRTASSWLQENLFTRPELGFYGPAESKKRRSLVKNVGHFLVADETGHLINDWEFDADAVRASLASLEAREGLWPVVSYERLGGHPLSNGFDRRMICHRIKAVFPNARILICIREQGAIVLSNYMQYLRNGGWNTPEVFVTHRPDGRQPTLSLKFWEYHTLISMYYDAFGRESVLILPYELFASEPQSFIKRICDFVGLPTPHDLPVQEIVNVRRAHVSSYYSRLLTPWGRSTSANGNFPASKAGRAINRWVKGVLDRTVPKSWEERTRKNLQRRVEQCIGDYYCESNRVSQHLTGLDLAGFGYRV